MARLVLETENSRYQNGFTAPNLQMREEIKENNNSKKNCNLENTFVALF
jgi:hypothetical protein